MQKRVACLTVMALFGWVAQATAQKPGAVAGPKGPADEAIEMWQETAKGLIAMAEEFPDSKFDYKPTPEVRTFAEQLLHAADGNFAFVEIANGREPQFDSHPRSKYDSKAKIVELLKQSVDAVCAQIKKTGDAGMQKPIKFPFGPPRMVSTAAFWSMFRGHMVEHYGQLVIYYRLNKLVPPSSRPRKA
jgi:hypothetical protein